MAGNEAGTEAAIVNRRGSLVWIQGLACGALLTFAMPTALLLAVLLAPSIICFLADTAPQRGVLRAVTLSCAAASFSPVWHLWQQAGRLDAAVASLSDLTTLMLAWGAGASAWALCQVIPVVLRTAWDMREATKARIMQSEIDQLVEEWALDTANL